MEWVPDHVSSAGEETVELAASAGLLLDPWQQHVLIGGMGERADGRWSAFEVGLLASRQNGKGGVFEARELAGLFLLGERLIVHSAHLFETSMEHMLRVLTLIESNPDLDRRVARVSRAHGEEGITLLPRYGGCRLKFKTRTKGGGRGLSGDCVILDEAMELSAAALAALMPTLSARPNPQLWYGGSAVDQLVHANGLVFAKVRERGHKGGDPSLAWFEWAVDPDVYYADPARVATSPEFWAVGNPGLGIRITAEYIANEQRSLPPREFATERLGIGDWPSTDDEAERVISSERWGSLCDPYSWDLEQGAATQQQDGPVSFAIDVNPERSHTSIAVAGKRADGRTHVEVVDHRTGTGWVVDRMRTLKDRWSPCAVLVDARGPAASLIPDLVEAGFQPVEDGGVLEVVNTPEMVRACGAFYDDAVNDMLRHIGQSHLDGALASARKRDLGDAWAWARKSAADISPLVAATLARYGAATFADGPVALDGSLMA